MSTISASTTSTTAYKVTADTTGSLVLQTGSGPTTAVTIDTSQNVGIGVTPSAWGSGSQALQNGNYALSIYGLTKNAYYDGSNYKYISTAGATLYQPTSVQHAWYIAPSGTAGNAITFTQAMTLTADGNLGIGTTNPGTIRLELSGAAAGASFNAFRIGNTDTTASSPVTMFFLSADDGTARNRATISSASDGSNNGYLSFSTRSSGTIAERMRIDSSGNLGIGATTITSLGSGYQTTQLQGANGSGLLFYRGASTQIGYLYGDSNGMTWATGSAIPLMFLTNNTERARITSSGYFKASNTGTYISSTGAYHELSSDSSSAYAVYIRSTASATGSFGINLSYPNRAPNDTGNDFITCSDSAATRFTARSNGGLANYSANNVNLSDERTKTDIQDAGGYLAKICAIPVRTFKYKDQTDDLLNLGCIAQEVEAVAPELVDVSGFGETPEDGVPLKAIYQTDFQYALMKCIQEQQAIIETLTNRITALEAK